MLSSGPYHHRRIFIVVEIFLVVIIVGIFGIVIFIVVRIFGVVIFIVIGIFFVILYVDECPVVVLRIWRWWLHVRLYVWAVPLSKLCASVHVNSMPNTFNDDMCSIHRANCPMKSSLVLVQTFQQRGWMVVLRESTEVVAHGWHDDRECESGGVIV